MLYLLQKYSTSATPEANLLVLLLFSEKFLDLLAMAGRRVEKLKKDCGTTEVLDTSEVWSSLAKNTQLTSRQFDAPINMFRSRPLHKVCGSKPSLECFT